jgi:hypothetical protein
MDLWALPPPFLYGSLPDIADIGQERRGSRPFDRSADAARESMPEEAGQDTPGAVEKNH